LNNSYLLICILFSHLSFTENMKYLVSCIKSKGICLPIRCLPGMRDIGTCGLRRTKCCKRN
uniref:Beta/alpha-defensin C-terminal domain-containing protein n=1 Tax=Equus caballus TaxID=9796 RepID=F6V4F0_HORSE